jgi:hypothetical protein
VVEDLGYPDEGDAGHVRILSPVPLDGIAAADQVVVGVCRLEESDLGSTPADRVVYLQTLPLERVDAATWRRLWADDVSLGIGCTRPCRAA